MRTKRDLDSRIAAATGYSLHEVSSITAYFLRLLSVELGRGESVDVRGFATFSIRRYVKETPDRTVLMFHVYMKKSATLLRVLRSQYVPEKGDPMEKYAVNEKVDQEKLEEAEKNGCPECGAKVARHGQTVICPKCGSRPFEQTK